MTVCTKNVTFARLFENPLLTPPIMYSLREREILDPRIPMMKIKHGEIILTAGLALEL